jgi:signal transduction histidine kinase
LADALAGGWSGEVLFWDGQGEPFPVALSLRPLMDERQTEPLVAGTAHDLTELKQREADLQSALGEVAEARRQLQVLNTNLESTVHSRTAELADTVKQLERMNEELKELDDLKSEFVTLVSHELRGPLTNIRSGVELALRRSEHLPESAEETLELVSAETERLASFVEIILDLSALEAGRFPLELERIPVPVICRAVVSRIPPESGSQRIRLAMEDSLPVVSADERSLTSVLFHLLDNALKYAPDGLVTLGAACDAGMLKVTVADAGPGIAPEAREAVFERFRRLDTRDSRETYGHGLGLYLSRRLVEAMGGRIKAGESAAGGAELTFWLPLADA